MKNFGKKLRKWNRIFCSSMTCKTNMTRDAVIVMVVVIISALTIYVDRQVTLKKIETSRVLQESSMVALENSISVDIAKAQEAIDMTVWKMYRNEYYGFELRYPENWNSPKSQNRTAASKWEARYQFRGKISDANNSYAGFDVAVYDLAKVKELSGTDEFPTFKNESLKTDPACQLFSGYLIETGDYPAEEVYVPLDDKCYNQSLFFHIIKDQYIYNIIAITKNTPSVEDDNQVRIKNNFPEFFAVVATFDNVDIVRPKSSPKTIAARPAQVKPKITAPKPVMYKVDGAGRLVCSKKNDKPKKSKKNKSKHLDMECCLDPNEYPNPWCYYDPKKYGKYL